MKTGCAVNEWIQRPKINKILLSFSVPKTPTQVEKEIGVKKIKLKPFLKNNLIKILNPYSRKGRFYILTLDARRLLKISNSEIEINKNWELVGWIMASPRQRFVIMKVMNSEKRTSDEIMEKAIKLNHSVTRISTKEILKELIDKDLVETELTPKLRKVIRGHSIYGKKLRRYYWLSEEGEKLVEDIKQCFK
jgi:hypothetical protein